MRAKVTFKGCTGLEQEIGTPAGAGDRFVARLPFDLEINGKTYSGMETEIRQPHGFDYRNQETFPIEVSAPKGPYRGPFNHESFSKAAESYYREEVLGANGLIKVGPSAAINIKVRKVVARIRTFEIDMPDKGGAW